MEQQETKMMAVQPLYLPQIVSALEQAEGSLHAEEIFQRIARSDPAVFAGLSPDYCLNAISATLVLQAKQAEPRILRCTASEKRAGLLDKWMLRAPQPETSRSAVSGPQISGTAVFDDDDPLDLQLHYGFPDFDFENFLQEPRDMTDGTDGTLVTVKTDKGWNLSALTIEKIFTVSALDLDHRVKRTRLDSAITEDTASVEAAVEEEEAIETEVNNLERRWRAAKRRHTLARARTVRKRQTLHARRAELVSLASEREDATATMTEILQDPDVQSVSRRRVEEGVVSTLTISHS